MGITGRYFFTGIPVPMRSPKKNRKLKVDKLEPSIISDAIFEFLKKH